MAVHRQRTWPVQRLQRSHIVERRWFELPNQRLHAGRVELENPQRVSGREHLVGGRVVHVAKERRIIKIDLNVLVVFHMALRIRNHREVSQPQEVHLQQAKRFSGVHLPLGDDRPVVGTQQRHCLRQRLGAYDHSSRVDAVLTFQPLELLGRFQNLCIPGVFTGLA